MNTWEIFGHDWAVEMLQKHVANATLRHAYLLTGPEGVGRRALAIRLAQALNCADPTPEGNPCRVCRTCRQVEAGQHPDLLVIEKLPDKKDISIDQIRTVSKFLSLKPYLAAFKIVLILDFEHANANAQNALLKTLEEAPGYAILLLTAENAEQLLPTIVSRCEILRLRPLTAGTMIEFLTVRDVPPERAIFLASLAEGRPGYALELFENEAALSFRVEKLDDLHKLLASKLVDRFRYAEKLARDKDMFRQTLLIWLSFWRDVFLKASRAGVGLTNIDRVEEIEKLGNTLDRTQARGIATAIEKAIERLDRNVNPRMLAEIVLMDWPRLKLT